LTGLVDDRSLVCIEVYPFITSRCPDLGLGSLHWKVNSRWISAASGSGRGPYRGLCREATHAIARGADPAIYRSVNL